MCPFGDGQTQVARSAPVFSHLFTPNFAGKRSRRYSLSTLPVPGHTAAVPVRVCCLFKRIYVAVLAAPAAHLLQATMGSNLTSVKAAAFRSSVICCSLTLAVRAFAARPCMPSRLCAACRNQMFVLNKNGASRTTAGRVTLAIVCRNEFAVLENESTKRVSQTWS